MNNFDYDFYKFSNSVAKKNSTVVFGCGSALSIPVSELAQSLGFNFNVYNRSVRNLSLRNAKNNYFNCVEGINPEALIIQLGENDIELFKSTPDEFDKLYLDFMFYLKTSNPDMRIQLVSVENESNNQLVSDMNRHIKAIAAAERCEFFTVESARLWKPCSTTAAASFLYKIGFDRQLSVKHPLYDTAKALFSYVFAKGYYQPRTA